MTMKIIQVKIPVVARIHISYIRITVFWVLTLCGIWDRYQHFGEICCLHLQGESLLHGVRDQKITVRNFTTAKTWNLI